MGNPARNDQCLHSPMARGPFPPGNGNRGCRWLGVRVQPLFRLIESEPARRPILLGEWAQRYYVSSTTPGVIFEDLLIIGTRLSESAQAAPGQDGPRNVQKKRFQASRWWCELYFRFSNSCLLSSSTTTAYLYIILASASLSSFSPIYRCSILLFFDSLEKCENHSIFLLSGG